MPRTHGSFCILSSWFQNILSRKAWGNSVICFWERSMWVTKDSPQPMKMNQKAHTSVMCGDLGYEWSTSPFLWRMRAYGGFMRNVPHSLEHLNTLSPAGCTVLWGSGGALKVKILPPLLVCSFGCILEAKGRNFVLPALVLGLPTTMEANTLETESLSILLYKILDHGILSQQQKNN